VAEGQRTAQDVGQVDLEVPTASEHLRLLRLVSSCVGARLGLDIDQLDDLRIAVGELCTLLIENASPGGRLRLSLRAELGRLGAEVSLLDDTPVAGDLVSQLILDGLDLEWGSDPSSSFFWLVAPR